MPKFLGIFTRKSKHASPTSGNASDDRDSSISVSPTVSSPLAWDKSHLQTPPRSTLHAHTAPSVHSHNSASIHGEQYAAYPSSPSASSVASSSKLRLPFARNRKKPPPTAAMTSTTSVNTTETHSITHREFHSAPPPSLPLGPERSSFASDGELTDLRRLRPPPSKSAIFAAYADPHNALSTRSLPNEASQPFALEQLSFPTNTVPSASEICVSMSTPDSATKKSFFSWTKSPAPTKLAKSRSKSTPPSQTVEDTVTDASSSDFASSSFNLKSFRHVGPASAPDTPVSSTTLSVPIPSPLPRPRGPSIGESSQRISVAAFREAQARRSMASSPVPSFRSSSPFSAPSGPQEVGGSSGRASPRLYPARSSFIQDSRRSSQNLQKNNNKGAFVSDSDADTSSALDDSDEDSDRERTVTQRGVRNGKARAKSELGHGSSRQESSETRSEAHYARPQSRQRASASTSALVPSADAKRASILVNSNSNDSTAERQQNSRHIREGSVRPTSSSSSSSSEDDAPLATLVPPRRPGSALSTASGSSLRSSQNRNRSNITLPPARAKPLIDISEVMGGKPSSLPVMEGRKEELSEDRGFTRGNTLLSVTANPNASPPSGARIPAPINTSFITSSPHTLSPTESVNSSGFVTAPSSVKTPYGRFSPAPTATEQAAARRDMLSDRLARATKGASSAVNFPSPLSTPLTTPSRNDAPTADVTKQTAFPRTLASPRPSFELSKSPGPSSLALRRSVDLTSSVPPRIPALQKMNPSPPDEELMQMLGASIKLISITGESSPEATNIRDNSESEESDEESSDDDDNQNIPESQQDDEKATDEWEKVDPGEVNEKEEYKGRGTIRRNKVLGRVKDKGKEKEVNVDELAPKVTEPPIAPIPIKQRAPTPSFSVMSRPPLVRSALAPSISGSGSGPASRSGSTSAVPSSTSSTSSSSSGTKTRRRSSTLLNPSLGSLEFPDSKPSNTSLSPAGIRDAARARGAALNAPALRSPAMSRGSGISRGSVQDSGSHVESNRSSIIDNPPNLGGRPRSSTMVAAINIPVNVPSAPTMPVRPFARRESPASSGDSSSGRAPLTPRDGSDVGSAGGNSKVMRAIQGAKYAKRRSVSFEDELRDDDDAPSLVQGKGKMVHKESKDLSEEEKRRERRRGEAKAAIELGNVINGRGPVVDDEGEDMPTSQTTQPRMSTLNPMMAMGGGMHPMQMGSIPTWNGPWNNAMGQRPMMNGPQFMLTPAPADPSLMAAHQQAMMIAKQAYQMAVAQQAVAAAGDEWERGSVASGFSPFGGGIPSPHMAPAYGVGMNMNMNMGMMGMGANWPSGGSTIYPSTARPVYGGISGARSDYGGIASGGGGWSSSRSTYGEAFGPPTGRVPKSGVAEYSWRDSTHYPPVPPIPQHAQSSTGGRTSTPRARTTSQPASARNGTRRAPPPPSSWKGA